jgi:hypothetical protein
MFLENNLRESDRGWGGFLEKEERDKSMGLGFFYVENESCLILSWSNCLLSCGVFFCLYTYTN